MSQINNTIDVKMRQFEEKYADLIKSKPELDQKVGELLKRMKKLGKEIDMEREFLELEGKYEQNVINLIESQPKTLHNGHD